MSETFTRIKDTNKFVSVRADGSKRVITLNDEPTMAKQEFKDECDINNIMKKYSTTGQFTHLTSKKGVYADFSQITDYQEMLQTVQYAQDAFSSLPAEVRSRFANDPGKLLEFIQDENNYDEGVKLGLVQPRPEKTPIKTNDPNDKNEGVKKKGGKQEQPET